ncbi:MAG: GGDEF domain-containing protein [Sulfurimonas sp.]|nr:GGDEF domain-containing protein [Sulfurimonas sp.]
MTRDITELHLAQEKVKAQSYIDELTKLYNRKSYNERIEELLSLKKRNQTPFSMIIYDIDNFKSVNDTYGAPGW